MSHHQETPPAYPGPVRPRDPNFLLEEVERLPRSPQELPTFRVDWRFLQVELYAAEILRRMPGASPPLPSREDDEWVRRYYEYRTRHPDREEYRDGAIRWAEDCFGDLLGSKVKAMLMAGRSVETIAGDLGVQPDRIEAFTLLFYDVRPHLYHRHYIASIIVPFVPVENEDEQTRLERMWLLVARNFPDMLDNFLCPQLPVDEEMERKFLEAIRHHIMLRGYLASLLERFEGLPEPGSIQRALACSLADARKKASGDTGHSAAELREALLAAFADGCAKQGRDDGDDGDDGGTPAVVRPPIPVLPPGTRLPRITIG